MKNFQTKKKYGQNFLTDNNLLSSICHDANLQKEDTVVEIGAGMGALTKHLSANCGRVLSFEIDEDLREILRGLNLSNVEFVFQDVLKVSLEEIEEKIKSEYKIVANLPYYITSPIIFKFLQSEKIQSLTVMVQKEVGERMTALPNSKDYGVLSVCLAVLGKSHITRIVKRNMFTPAPNVDSCIVKIEIKKPYNIKNYDKFFSFVKMIFSMRRKTLQNNLVQSGILKEELHKIFDEETLKRRSETFSVTEIVEMFEKINHRNELKAQ